MGAVPWLGNFDVTSNPLLKKGGQKSTAKTDGQTEEPERIDPYGIFRRGELYGWIYEVRRDRDGRTVSIGQKLIYICKIKFRVVLGVWSQVLDRYREQRCDGSREQTGLLYRVSFQNATAGSDDAHED